MKNERYSEKENRNNAPTDYNYLALIAVILNEDLTVDEAIKRFRL